MSGGSGFEVRGELRLESAKFSFEASRAEDYGLRGLEPEGLLHLRGFRVARSTVQGLGFMVWGAFEREEFWFPLGFPQSNHDPNTRYTGGKANMSGLPLLTRGF